MTLGEIRPRKTKGSFTKDPLNLVTVPAVARKLHVKLLQNLAKRRASSAEALSLQHRVEGRGPLGHPLQRRQLQLRQGRRRGSRHRGPGRAFSGSASRIRCRRARSREFLRRLREGPGGGGGRALSGRGRQGLSPRRPALTLPIRGKAPELFSRLYEFDPGHGAAGRRLPTSACPGHGPGPGRSVGPAAACPQRPPTLCAGCSHRATYYEVRKAAEELGIETIYPSDIGCYTLGLLPPLAHGAIT
ncbi:MAG: hypothetical protein MZV70_12185 [Desulfobacterales bacterium]|nr:hypothetical protein [Desulfobacterales bacterium]